MGEKYLGSAVEREEQELDKVERVELESSRVREAVSKTGSHDDRKHELYTEPESALITNMNQLCTNMTLEHIHRIENSLPVRLLENNCTSNVVLSLDESVLFSIGNILTDVLMPKGHVIVQKKFTPGLPHHVLQLSDKITYGINVDAESNVWGVYGRLKRTDSIIEKMSRRLGEKKIIYYEPKSRIRLNVNDILAYTVILTGPHDIYSAMERVENLGFREIIRDDFIEKPKVYDDGRTYSDCVQVVYVLELNDPILSDNVLEIQFKTIEGMIKHEADTFEEFIETNPDFYKVLKKIRGDKCREIERKSISGELIFDSVPHDTGKSYIIRKIAENHHYPLNEFNIVMFDRQKPGGYRNLGLKRFDNGTSSGYYLHSYLPDLGDILFVPTKNQYGKYLALLTERGLFHKWR